MAIYNFLKPETNKGNFNFVVNYLKKIYIGWPLRNIKNKYKSDIFTMETAPGTPWVSKDAQSSTKQAHGGSMRKF